MLSLIMYRILQIVRPPDDNAKRRADSTSDDQLLDVPYRSSLAMGKKPFVSLQSRTKSSLTYAAAFLVDSSTVTTSTPLPPNVSFNFLRK